MRYHSLDHGIVAMVHSSGMIGRFCKNAVCLIIRVVWSNEFVTNGDCTLAKISHSPSTVEILIVPLLDVGRKHHQSNVLALTDAEVPDIEVMQS
jgi:hypothetical protein